VLDEVNSLQEHSTSYENKQTKWIKSNRKTASDDDDDDDRGVVVVVVVVVHLV
jgi:hypothetical protein